VTCEVVAADGVRVACDLYAAAGPRCAALLAPALGVPLRFYAPFAEWLASEGITTLVAGGRDTTLRDWADLDLPAALAHLRAQHAAVVWIGHSMGGQLFGLLNDAPVERALFVAAQHGHWRNWHGWPRYAMAALWYVGIPALTAATGRLPMRPVGGQDVPAGIAREWASWGRSRDYVVGVARSRGASAFTRYAGPLVSYAISDDRYAPLSTVRPLAAAFTATRAEVREVSPARYGLTRMGHFGPFRPTARKLWAEWRDWLLDGAT
jgi:predicted alpha/beta hydrolase